MDSRRCLCRSLAVAAALAGQPLAAADLVEPWDRGLSNLELFTQFEEGLGPQTSTTIGFGLPASLSIGLSLASGATPDTVGLTLYWSRDLGRAGAFDLIFQTDTETGESELGAAARLIGVEWSTPGSGGPYLRWMTVSEDGRTRHHPLVGFVVPFDRVELHLELSSEEPEPGGSWPIHLAVGPNLRITDDLELLPELSVLYDRRSGEISTAFSIGFVTSPNALRRFAFDR
jgi:hypothetical protein